MLLDTGRDARLGEWIGTACRVGLAAVWLYAGVAKIGDLSGSIRAVKAYQLLPSMLAELIGAALPMFEIALALLLLAGLAVRLTAVLSALLLVAFIGGMVSAWARGLQIDCGCFGGGGELDPGQSAQYGVEIVRDVAFLLPAVYLVARPRTRLALDNLLTRKD